MAKAGKKGADVDAAPTKKGSKLGFIGAIAAAVVVAGSAAGLGAVYVMGGFSGNGEATRCADAEALSKTLTPLAVGDLAGLITSGESTYVGDLTYRRGDRRPTSLGSELSAVPDSLALVNLWATWCVPCREEMPALNRLEAQMGQDRFQVIAINVDTRDDGRVQRFMTDNQINDLSLNYDPTMGVFNALKARGRAVGLPTSLLVKAPGCVVAVLHGPAAWDSKEGVAVVQAMLDGPKPEAGKAEGGEGHAKPAGGEEGGEKPAEGH